MKDAHDKTTMDIAQVNDANAQTNAALAPQGHGCITARKPSRRPKPFDVFRSVMDEKTFCTPAPKGAKLVIAHGIEGGHFVPVSFVAKDWKVTPRRIRALLSGGRLAGRVQDNGYWEVRFPYSFTFGTRGPGLKRQQKQERRTA